MGLEKIVRGVARRVWRGGAVAGAARGGDGVALRILQTSVEPRLGRAGLDGHGMLFRLWLARHHRSEFSGAEIFLRPHDREAAKRGEDHEGDPRQAGMLFQKSAHEAESKWCWMRTRRNWPPGSAMTVSHQSAS